MQLREIMQIVRRRLWLIVLVTGATAIAALQLSARMPRVYRARVTMKVEQPVNAPLAYSAITTGESLATTYSSLLRTRPLLQTVISNLSLKMTPEELRADVSTDLVPDTPLLELTVEHSDAQTAADIANNIASTFVSLHNQERQAEVMTAFEQDIVAQMNNLKELIERNQALVEEQTAQTESATPATPAGPVQEPARSSTQSTLAAQQSTYAGLLSIYLDIQLVQSQFFDINVVDPAVAPTKPIRPHIPLYTMLGAMFGLTLSMGSVFLFELLDRSIKVADDVRLILPRPILGVIPQMHGMERSSSLVAWTAPHSAVTEAFRTLRTNLRFTGVDKPMTTILVTSPESGAGKTTVASNLAIVCAQAGLRVVAIDTDLRLPRLHKAFGLKGLTGLTDLLVNDVDDVTPYLHPTDVDNLYVIPCGPIPPNPSELLGSKRMKTVLENVRSHADLIILDASPVLPVTDSAVLASNVDGILFVVRANKTQREAMRHAAENLLQVGGIVVGTVLNGVPRPRGGYYDNYRREETRIPAGSRQPLVHQPWPLEDATTLVDATVEDRAPRIGRC